jgi:hypothetical protein
MHTTTHIDARMNQRGIRKELVSLAIDLGRIEGDRYVLDTKTIRAEMYELRRKLKFLDDAERKGGVVVVTAGDSLVTTYRADSFCRPGTKTINS